jgi:CMP-N-acetylneuraminic acid synthetase
MKILIPARKGSVGYPNKNRHLFRQTAASIPKDRHQDVWVTSDDPEILKMAAEYEFNIIERPDHLALDTTSIREVVAHALPLMDAEPDTLVLMLYLTYPERTWSDIESAVEYFISFYQLGLTESLLCKKPVKVHPYLHMYEYGLDGIFGRQLVQHDLCRRQDYPPCFEISHFISIFKASQLATLNRNMYCPSTVFYPICSNIVDVDLESDLKNVKEV